MFLKSFVGKIVLSVALVAFALALSALLGELIAPNAYQTLQQALKGSASNSSAILSVKVSQAIQTIGVFLLPALALVWIFYHRKGVTLMLGGKLSWRDFVEAAFLILFTGTLIALTAKFGSLLPWPKSWIEDNAESEKMTLLLMSGKTYADLVLNLTVIAILPAVCEEFFFRGFLQRMLMKWIRDPHLAIFIAAVLFSAIHFDGVMFIPRFLLGALLGYLFYWTGSLWLPIFAHFINNAQYVVSVFVINKMEFKTPVTHDVTAFEVSNLNVFLSIFVVALLLLSIYSRHMSVKDRLVGL
jgi:membrane protease YdiL (CAAX protease family)